MICLDWIIRIGGNSSGASGREDLRNSDWLRLSESRLMPCSVTCLHRVKRARFVKNSELFLEVYYGARKQVAILTNYKLIFPTSS